MRNPGVPWTPYEDEQLRALIRDHTREQIGQKLGRSAKSVAGRLALLRERPVAPEAIRPHRQAEKARELTEEQQIEQARALNYLPPTITAAFCGDPPPWRSALYDKLIG